MKKGIDGQIVTKEPVQEDYPMLKKLLTLHIQWCL